MSSAANTLPPGSGTHGDDENSQAGLNAMALEIPVSVTGAKASTTPGARDLFSEESCTVQVFKDGAVISLVAPIAEGQLLFLTNQKTNQEVVCQVVSKWDFQPPKCHVKLQFTEDRADYWGLEFPAEQPKTEFKAEKKSAKTSSPGPSLPIDSGKVENPSGLDNEVEALRKQLLGAETKKGEAQATKTSHMDHEAVTAAAAKVLEAATASVHPHKEELAPVNDQTPSSAKAAPAESLLMPAAKDKNEAARAVIGMALPISKAKTETNDEESEDPVEDLLPKADLDFSQAANKAPQAKAGKTIGRIQAPSLSKGRAIGLSAVLVLALVGGGWYGKWWQYLPAGKKTPTAAARSLPAKNAPKSPAAVPVAKAQAGANANPAQTSGETANTAASDTKEDAGTVKAADTDVSRAESRSVESTKEKTSHRKEKAEENAGTQVAPSASTVDAVANDGPVTAPKLLKAANPVYPPDAMRSYITGDVKAEVLVDAKGHVTEVSVLSGPQALRAAAVDALKQYQYAPAMQGGKTVEAKTTAVVKFWFNP